MKRQRLLCALLLAWPALMAAQNPPLSNPSACNLGLTIPDNTCPNTYTIQETGTAGILGQDVYVREVRLLIAHSWTNDLDITLIGPQGIEVVLSSDNGGSADNYGDLSAPGCSGYVAFSNTDACRPVTEGEAPFTGGPYLPEESLFQLNDGSTPANGSWQLRLCDDAGSDVGTLEYVALVFAPLSCLPPAGLAVASADTTSVWLDWDSEAGCGTSIVEYGPPGFTPGTDSMPGGGTVVFGGCPPFLLDGLASETTYDIYLRTYCPGEGFSANSCPVVHQTGCAPPPLTDRFTFDTAPTCPGLCDAACPLSGTWRNDTTDQQDWLVRSGPGGAPLTGPADDVDGGGRFLLLETTGSCPENGEARLRSNCLLLDKQGTDTCHLSFYYHMWGTTVGSLLLQASSDAGQSWTTLWSRSGNQGNAWQKAYVGLGGFADGATLQLRFIATRGAGSLGDIALDEISFYGLQDQGEGSLYFADQDGDGYGTPLLSTVSCTGVPPGFTDNNLDCDDQRAAVNPDAEEIPCDGLDQNCNGPADDSLAAPPPVAADTICSGQVAEVCAQPLAGNFIVWYDAPDSQIPLAFDDCYSSVFTNETSSPLTIRLYAEQVGVCPSVGRAETQIIVLPQPDIAVLDTPSLCPGAPIDLRSISVVDQNFTGGSLSFHAASPPSDQNRLDPPLVTPADTSFYYLRFTSPDGCIDTDSALVQVRPFPDISFSPADSFSLCLGAEEMLTAVVTNGAGAYQYFWNTGQQTPSIPATGGDSPGSEVRYILALTDELGCTTFDTATITTTTAIDSIRRQISPVSTCGGQDGSLLIEPLNGLPPFAFSWREPDGSTRDTSGVADALFLDGLAQGTYRFTITDNSTQACSIVLPSVVINGPAAVLDTFFINSVSCHDSSDGSIQLVVTGNNPTYLWSDGQTTATATGLSAGYYSVTITEGSCETALDSLEVDQPDPLQIQVQYDRPSCFQEDDGSLSVTAFGGAGGYTYNWDGGQSFLPQYGNLAAGTYNLRVQDQNGCLLDTSLVLNQPAPLTVVTDSLAPPSCSGFSDGLIATFVSGGTEPYAFSWAHGPTTATVVGLEAGTYELQLEDGNGCQANAAFQLADPLPIDLQVADAQQPVCSGDSTGAISLLAQGGSPPYIFQWDTGDTASVLTGLPVGDYAVSVTDSRTCPGDSLALSLDAVSSPVVLSLDVVAPTCVGLDDGMLTANPSGTAPFAFFWTTGDTTASVSGLGSDSVGLRVTDANGCFLDTSATLAAPQLIQLASSVQQPSCDGLQDGRITLNVLQGGGPGTTFTWNDGTIANQRTNLGAGTYAVTVENSQGCTNAPEPFVLQAPEPLQVSLLSQGDVLCQGDSSGFATFKVTGGTAPYDLRLNGGPVDTMIFAELPAGDYLFSARDAKACLDEAAFTIAEPEELDVSVELDTPDPCAQIDSIVLFAEVEGGQPKYTYEWSNGASTSLLTDPPPGDYAVTVTDGNGCQASAPEVKIQSFFEAFELDSFFVQNVSCFGSSDGQAGVQVSGGSQQYIFHFSNNTIIKTSEPQVVLSDLPVDDRFGVTVTDEVTGCVVASADLDISSPAPLVAIRDSLRNPACQGGVNGAVYTTTTGGTLPYSWIWTNSQGDTVGQVPDLEGLPAGLYQLQVTDARGCVYALPPVRIEAPDQSLTLVDSLTTITHVDCKGDSTGAISIALTGGTPPYRYDWGGLPFDGPQVQGLPAGLYTVIIEDFGGCTLIFQDFEIREPAERLEVGLEKTDVSCSGAMDGSLTANVQGGIFPYQLVWIRDMMPVHSGDPFLDGLAPGNYALAVEDSAGCFISAAATVQEPDPLEVDIQELQSGDSILLLADVTGGTPPYDFLWTGGDTTQVLLPPSEGLYRVTVTDVNDCQVIGDEFVTSTSEVAGVELFELFPNPVADELVLRLYAPEWPELSIQLFDARGRLLLSREPVRAAYPATLRLPVGDLPAGVYLVRLSSREGRWLGHGRVLKTTR